MMINIQGDSEMSEKTYFPLSQAQKRVWYTQYIYPESPLFVLSGIIKIHGHAEFDKLRKAITLFIENSDSFRIRLIVLDDVVKQYFTEEESAPIKHLDFSNHLNPEEALNKWMNIEVRRCFDLFESPLYEFTLFSSDSFSGYALRIHHIIADGWSMQLLAEGVSSWYERLVHEDNIQTNANKKPSYQAYLLSEQEYIKSNRYSLNRSYWLEAMADADSKDLTVTTLRGKRYSYTIPSELAQKISMFCRQYHISTNTLFSTLYLLYQWKITGQDEHIIGIPIAGRFSRMERETFGMMTGSIPLRLVLDANSSALDIFQVVYKTIYTSFRHARYPYNMLLTDLRENSGSVGVLYDVCVNTYATKMPLMIHDFPIETLEYFSGDSQFSMQLIIREWLGKDQYQIDVEYRCDDFSDCEAHAIPAGMMALFNKIKRNPFIKISRLSLISEDDKKLLSIYNATDMDLNISNVVDAIKTQADISQERVALRQGSDTMTYREMIKKAMSLSALLVKLGVNKGSCVALLASHSSELIISIIAILGAGGFFLPLDPRHPKQRMTYMLQNAKVMHLLTDSIDEIPEGYTGQVINITNLSILKDSANNFPVSPNSEDMSYVIYTSGTTGHPKGVAVKHGSLVNYIKWAAKTYVHSENDVFAFYSSVAVDLTITSIFTPLLSGCELDIYVADKPDSILDILKDNRCTILKLTPSHLVLLAENSEGNTSLQRLIVGGENLLTSVIKKVDRAFGRELDVYNEYGPTEATVGCMIHLYDRNVDVDGSVPIGRPIANTKIYIMNPTLEPVPIGVPGELFIGGDGVALGYINNPELTETKFITWHGDRLYASGDIARLIKPDCMEYLGRIDNQVKVHGHRIETEEIKAALLDIDKVDRAEVILWEPPIGSKRLVAYIVGTASEEYIRHNLSNVLPAYMIPALYVWLYEIPLLTNGKVDIKSLPAPILVNRGKTSANIISETESILIREVDTILALNGEINITDDFIKLGGDSIKAILLSSNIKRYGYDLPVKDIITNTVLSDMIMYMRKDDSMHKPQQEAYGDIDLTPPIRWFNKNIQINKNKYHHRITFRLVQPVDLEILHLAVSELLQHHAILRANYNHEKNLLFYNKSHDFAPPPVFFHDLSGSKKDAKKMIEVICETIENNHRIEKDLLFALCYFQLSENNWCIVITAHHLLVDGVSWHIIIGDLVKLLKLKRENIKGALGQPSASYKEWAEMINSKWRDNTDEIPYWTQVERIIVEKSRHKRIMLKDETAVYRQSYSTQFIADIHKPYNTTDRDILTTALALTIMRINDTGDVLLQMEGHGRNAWIDGIDITRTVGWMTSMYPVYINVSEKTLGKIILEVKQTLQAIPAGGSNYYTLLEHSELLGKVSTDCLVRINFLGEIKTSNDTSTLLIPEMFSLELDAREKTDCLAEFNIAILFDEIHLYMRSSYYEQEDLTNFVSTYYDSLQKIILHCLSEEKRHYLPSDFTHVQLTLKELEILLEDN